jgi:hypothetical protein
MFFKILAAGLVRVQLIAQHCCVTNTKAMIKTTITMRVALNGAVTGSIAGYDFGALVEAEPSIDGINEGRVCRLSITKGTDQLLMYDRGWKVTVPGTHCSLYEQVIKALEELPA